jgi:hypothetical protein
MKRVQVRRWCAWDYDMVESLEAYLFFCKRVDNQTAIVGAIR